MIQYLARVKNRILDVVVERPAKNGVSFNKKVGETFDMVYEYENTKVRRAFTILEIKKNVE